RCRTRNCRLGHQNAVLAQVKDGSGRRSCASRRLNASITYQWGNVCAAGGLDHHTTAIRRRVLNRTGSRLPKTACASPENGCNKNSRYTHGAFTSNEGMKASALPMAYGQPRLISE